MKTGMLFGKGPSWNPRLCEMIQPDEVVCINEAGKYKYHGYQWVKTVCSDKRVLKNLTGTKWATIYAPDRDRAYIEENDNATLITYHYYNPIDYKSNWKERERATESMENIELYQEGYTSTNGLWLLWLLGCDVVFLNGIGDPEDAYHPTFDGQPGAKNQGAEALKILKEVAKAKGVKLYRLEAI